MSEVPHKDSSCSWPQDIEGPICLTHHGPIACCSHAADTLLAELQLFKDKMPKNEFGSYLTVGEYEALKAERDQLKMWWEAQRVSLATYQSLLAARDAEVAAWKEQCSHPHGGMTIVGECVDCRQPYPKWSVDSGMKCPECKRRLLLVARDAQVEAMHAALTASVRALDNWLNMYAPEYCDSQRVAEARQEIIAGSGTLAYIAKLQQVNRAALASGGREEAS